MQDFKKQQDDTILRSLRDYSSLKAKTHDSVNEILEQALLEAIGIQQEQRDLMRERVVPVKQAMLVFGRTPGS